MRVCSAHNQCQLMDDYASLWTGRRVKYQKGITNDPYVLSIVAKGTDFVLQVHPFFQDSKGNITSQGFTEDSGNVRTNIPNASKERNLRDTSRYSRVLFKCIPGMQGSWRVASSNRLKKQLNDHINTPHFHISAEYP